MSGSLAPAVPTGPATAPAPVDLHPALWRASQLGRVHAVAIASGFDELDAVLPGGGWPARALTELLLPHPGLGELRLLAPVLAMLQARGRSVLWFDPPGEPSAWALEALGIRTGSLVLVRPRQRLEGRARERLPAAELLWALEQALASGQAGAVLAWLPARLRADALRRLQLAAQAHDGPAFLLREAEARLRPSAAPLRVVLAGAGPGRPDRLRLHLIKRRGPPLAQPLELALPPVLAPAQQARAAQGACPMRGAAGVLAVAAAPDHAAPGRGGAPVTR